MNDFLEKALNDIREERIYQQNMWGDEFDSKNTPNDWVSYITKYTGHAVTLPWNPEQFRKNLIKVATLCLAAAEWHDRTEGKMAKRHYD